MSTHNIFYLTLHNGLPLKVKQRTWESTSVTVVKVEPKGKYGKAWGYYNSKPDELQEINGAGNFKWQIVEEN